jgi:hypothetical protein
MNSVYEPSDFGCSNAFWDGRSTNFCAGLAVDDVIAHEWTHAYTDNTHDLIYAWQPGAINEAYSDIFGETVDLLNGSGLDVPNRARRAADCSTLSGQLVPTLEVSSPATVAGTFEVFGGSFNPPPPWVVSAAVELADDGTGTTSDGCQPIVDFTTGGIALIDRGECTFVVKIQNAEDAGAAGVIIVNDQGDDLVRMGGEAIPRPNIPAVFIGQTDGEALKAVLPEGVDATISRNLPSDDSVRWLVAEDSGEGAFRDMWNPNCFYNPGRVSDPYYWCEKSDSGGVHLNSGIPNHAFALIADGGGYNGYDVQPIGLTKAAHIYWRSMFVYQVPTTKFADHADALELSCSDLIGQQLIALETGDPSPETIDAFDCQQVAQAMLAVEMRSEPIQCGFEPILGKPAPAVTLPYLAYAEDFETDPTDRWAFSNEEVFEEYVSSDWRWTALLPRNRGGAGLHAVNSNFVGTCQEGDNQSGVRRAESPGITLPDWTTEAVLIFDHYVALEEGWDGGNLKISVNGGDYQLVAAEHFLFNPYNSEIIDFILYSNQEFPNTNPMAGEPAYTGIDGGEAEGSWYQSQVDLTAYGSAGDTIRIRFDLGNDRCVGIDGWYLDDVKVRANAEPQRRRRAPDRRLSPSRGVVPHVSGTYQD